MINVDNLYYELMKASNRAIVAFNALTLDLVGENQIKYKKIINEKNKLSQLLWDWQKDSENYLKLKAPKSREESKTLFSYKIYESVEKIVDLCYTHKDHGVNHTVSDLLYKVCLFSAWFISSIEMFYMGKFSTAFASDIFDVTYDYIKYILEAADKCNESYSSSILKAIQNLKKNHPLIDKSPLGNIILRSEFENIIQ